MPGTSTAEETAALAAALRGDRRDDRDIDAFDDFLEAYPASRWAPGLHLNLGTIAYDRGYFQDALAHWKAAWELARAGEDRVSQDFANLALAESAKMNARIGRLTELEALLAEAQKRNLMGDARVKIEGASEGAWMMRHQPGVSFRCGPYALLSVAKEQKLDVAKRTSAFLEKTQSPLIGFSIPEVQRMSVALGLKLQIAKREIGAPVIVPAVVHWKLGHFAAVVRQVDGKILLKDPTFGHDQWVTSKALDREASGYFLVPAGPLPSGWSRATVAETTRLYGKGYTSVIADDTAGFDHMVGGLCQSERGSDLAMAMYRFHTLAASVHIEDTPVGYTAAFGPDVRVKVTYNQREAGQPTAMDFTNFGPHFVNNWMSYIQTGSVVRVTLPGGGMTSYLIGGTSPENRRRGEVLTSLSASSTYKIGFPDGREQYYEHVIEVADVNAPPQVYLSSIADPQGNRATVDYDSTYPTRIHQIVDASGLPTVFHYDYPGELYLVTSIEDPYGRTATFAYAPTAGAVRLQSTEDPYGIVSSFTYNATGEIVAMTTPYGTTKFTLSDAYVHTGEDLIRYVEATDPLGETERVEFNMGANTGVSPTLESPQPDPAVINVEVNYTNYRNSFYWDKLLMKLAPGNHQKARLYHWVHQDLPTVTGILESEVSPLEGRIFYNYPGQSYANSLGTLDFPSAVGRVVKDAAGNNQTQATKLVYNGRANVTKMTDPVGREVTLDYGTNDVDVLTVKQKTGASTTTTIASATYGGGAPAHRPASVTDGAGHTTSYTYSSTTGQVSTITNAKSEVTTFTYETNTSSAGYGRLLSVTGDVAGGNRTFTYDSFGRVRTTTDSEGYTLTYDYDSLDRLRTITYPDATHEQREYDDHSLVATRDREGRWMRHMYNPLMQRVLTLDPELRTTQFDWCRCGDLRRFVDGNGNVTEWDRDEGSRIKKTTHADGSFETFTYDLSGRLSTSVDAMSRAVTYSYGIDDRLAKRDFSDTSTPDVTYAYDAWYPRLTSRVDGAGTTTFTYQPDGASTNGAGQVALVNGPLSNDTLRHTYDELGRLKKMEIVSDATPPVASSSEEYTFDARSRVTTVVNNLGSTTYAFVGQSNRPSTVDYANGMQTQFDYFSASGDRALKQIKNLTGGPTRSVISQFDYTYQADRSIATWKEDQGSGAKTWTFGYDAARQLTKAERRDGSQALLESLYYGYDKAGNRVQVGSGTTPPMNSDVNNVNQMMSERDHGRTTFAGLVDEPATVKVNGKPARVTSTDGGAPFKFQGIVDLDAGANTVVVEAKDGTNNVATKTYSVTTTGTSKTYEYDAEGNLRYEKQPNGTVIREYRWDQQNRLVRALIGTHESVYSYDGASRRVRIQELESGVQTKDETFVWCGSRICEKRNGATLVRSYFGSGFEESGSTHYFYTLDHLGSVRDLVGSDGTTVASRLSYDPWGKAAESGSVSSDFTYTGHHYDRPTGLALAWFRGYEPTLGRWLSTDPAGLRGGVNLYRYANNDPIRYSDPSGRIPMDGEATDRAIGSAQNWSDSNFQSGLIQGAVAGALLDAAVVAVAPVVSTQAGISLWGTLQGMGRVGRLITVLLGAPAGAAIDLSKKTIPTALPGQLPGGAGDCVKATQDSIATFGGTPKYAGWPHWANDLGDGMIHDPTLKGNLFERGAYVGDIADQQTIFTEEEWVSLVSRVK